MIFDAFDRIRIVNLRSRPDRRAQMKRELAALGLEGDPRIVFFDAVRPNDKGDFSSIGARGVFASQLTILQNAAAAGESLLILEDDCYFTDHAAQYRTDERWDIFYGGYEASDPNDPHGSEVIIGAHMMGFSARGARLMADYLDKLAYKGVHPPIDGAYVWFRRAHPDVPTHFAAPPLAYQRPSRTDIADLSFFDRWPGVRLLAQAARRLKHMLRKER